LPEKNSCESNALSRNTERSSWRHGVSTSTVEIEVPFAQEVTVTDETLGVELSDGRSIAVPLGWYPRLVHATASERSNWKLVGKGEGIHWPDLDEDISVEGLLAGKPSGESQTSFANWLKQRPRPTSRCS